ncbi:hypothetical protein Scep_016251 [Stephania cephalantha]|uniref:Uncharacterized protein n=1 Tax=Stephania cephalantha TaxID=152367 RepID=A0AAP0ING2_9MAGN
MESGSGDDLDFSDSQERKSKRYHRHTARQIQQLEALFKECPHPDERQRMQLSRDLNLEPRQIKFWFQNRRTQMKMQHERSDNCALRMENDKIRCENIAIREALRNVICPSCGGPPVDQDGFVDEQKLRMENAQLKEELDRISSITAKYIGRPISRLPSIQPIAASSLNLSMASYDAPDFNGPSLDLDLLPGSSSAVPPLPFPFTGISDIGKSLMMQVAANAMDEFVKLAQTDEPLWIKSDTSEGTRDVLQLESYQRLFPKANVPMKSSLSTRIEASRDSGLLITNTLALVDMFMDANKWAELFPTIVSEARIIEVLSSGMMGSRSGSLQLMYDVLQVLSPLVATREFYFLRYCQQIEQGLWAIVDVSFDLSQETQLIPPSNFHKRPSGCLIQDMPNGYCKITWVEHVEVEENTSIHWLYRDLIQNGLAFSADRWIAVLRRMCERFACLMVTGTSSPELGGVIPSAEGKRSMMKLAQRMVNNFCASIKPSSDFRWTTLSGGLDEVGVRVSFHKSTDLGQPGGLVLTAATSIWLPLSPQLLFNFFKDDKTRSEWDVLSSGSSVQEVFRITNGSHPDNCISVLRQAHNSNRNNMLVLQESCIDSSGFLIVYATVDLIDINVAMNGEDSSCIALVPCGFTIIPDGRRRSSQGSGASSSATSQGGGSLLTVALQIQVSSLPSSKLNSESVTTVNNLINSTVQQIKAALNCSTGN